MAKGSSAALLHPAAPYAKLRSHPNQAKSNQEDPILQSLRMAGEISSFAPWRCCLLVPPRFLSEKTPLCTRAVRGTNRALHQTLIAICW
jgi:hypothetical protein